MITTRKTVGRPAEGVLGMDATIVGYASVERKALAASGVASLVWSAAVVAAASMDSGSERVKVSRTLAAEILRATRSAVRLSSVETFSRRESRLGAG